MLQSTPLWQARTDPPEKDFKIDANGARAFMGHFPCGVETAKRFVNVHLHCNLSNQKEISKMSMLSPSLKYFCHTRGYFHPSTSFDLWASQAKLTIKQIN